SASRRRRAQPGHRATGTPFASATSANGHGGSGKGRQASGTGIKIYRVTGNGAPLSEQQLACLSGEIAQAASERRRAEALAWMGAVFYAVLVTVFGYAAAPYLNSVQRLLVAVGMALLGTVALGFLHHQFTRFRAEGERERALREIRAQSLEMPAA